MVRLLTPLILIGYSTFLLPARAQSTAHRQQHASPSIIDGAVHPELIPDSAAYRLYFLAVSTGPNPSDEDLKRQRSRLSKIGLEDLDREIIVAVLMEFRTRCDALMAQYNEAAKAAVARNQPPDTAAFVRQLNELVQSTRDTLKLRLTPLAMSRFDATVQSEKKHMTVHGADQ